ncbi:hypothetical protein [Paraburkholderia haematera]|uniref:Uncharacterized protein n=1 Tax=Paraburkholderia haematera TaxID=2793077 RepID=A0ABN7KL73_9BURK|nr:hypothetical protein [Paraburkholderia haematera]CAE6699058.1 hypothetical protein R69888_00635 [Paraburkholderia haematera]
MSSSLRALVFVTVTIAAFAAPVAYGAGLAGTYEICRTPADEQGWDAEKRDLRIRFTDEDGKYAVAFRFKANGAWKTYTDGPYEAAPPSRFRELSGAPYLSPESGAVPDGARLSKDVPLETVVVPDTLSTKFKTPAKRKFCGVFCFWRRLMPNSTLASRCRFACGLRGHFAMPEHL